jgi:hypothetical protein
MDVLRLPRVAIAGLMAVVVRVFARQENKQA